MAKKQKACVGCKIIFNGDKCPLCNENVTTDAHEGRVYVFNPEESIIAKNMKIHHKGEFAIKTN